MKYSEAAIKRFLQLGESREKFFLRWDGRESFFDSAVQTVLMTVHPEKIKNPDEVHMAFPIEAWSRVDSVARSACDSSWKELLPLMQAQPAFLADLLAAVMHYRQSAAERFKNPVKTLDCIQKWRTRRYLAETTPFPVTHEQAVKQKTLRKKASVQIKKRRTHGGPPLPISETPKPPTIWMDGKRNLSPEAYRQAVSVENKRRDKIMRQWAACWMAYLRIPGVT